MSEENHEGLQDSMSPSLDWRQQGHSVVSGQFGCRFYSLYTVGWKFQNTVLTTCATYSTVSEVCAVYPTSMILRTNKLNFCR